MENYLISVAGTAGIYLACLIPLFALAFLTSPKPARLTPLFLFAVFLTLDIGLIFLFKVITVIPGWGGWNWQGKLLELSWPLLLLAFVPGFTASATGLSFKTIQGSWRVMTIVCVLYAIVNTPLQLLLGAHFSLHVKLPEFLYEATMPGLGEEFVYRGVLLALLNELFGRPWKLLGARFGWGLVITSVMFGLLHGLDIHGFSVHHIYWVEMIFAFVMGVVLAWLRERTGSVWPGVAFHNLANVMNILFV
ncbi:MAG: CPBP family intramembrane metalloprotease [Gammaproteobacteria bacterium]|nr:CPBP family intramembrane metalloprotease [Gammaproteobacteria bacterium]MDE2346651.1 CPBP family intramembrane metalloprotease [Gammaproteobacteria bacterium]